jgi:hypothetical protein
MGYNRDGGAKMQTMEIGRTSVLEAFEELKAGNPVYIASAPEGMDTQMVRGAWKDSKGKIYHDLCAFYSHKDTAMTIAHLYGQKCIFCLYPAPLGNGRVYLLKDSLRNRVLALRYGGGYVSDSEHLLIACLGSEPPFEMEIVDSLPVDLVLSFVVEN